MHIRKRFLVYPPEYNLNKYDGYLTTYSRFQAKKAAARLGVGAKISVSIHHHPSSHKSWYSAGGGMVQGTRLGLLY